MKQSLSDAVASQIVTDLAAKVFPAFWRIDDQGGRSFVRQGNFGELGNDDAELKADQAMGNFLAQEVMNHPDVAWVTVEGGIDRPTGNPGARLWVTFDPIDGSLDYYRPAGMLPFGTVITVFDTVEEATLTAWPPPP